MKLQQALRQVDGKIPSSSQRHKQSPIERNSHCAHNPKNRSNVMSLQAIEIELSHPVTEEELKSAAKRCRLRMAPSCDRTRLLTVVKAKNRQAAIKRVWRRVDGILPVDTVCTVYASADGKQTLGFQFDAATSDHLAAAAAAAGLSIDEYLTAALMRALAGAEAARRSDLSRALAPILHKFSAPEVTAEAARRITR